MTTFTAPGILLPSALGPVSSPLLKLNLADPLDPAPVVPTVTVGVAGAVSAITGAANGTMSIPPNDARIVPVGTENYFLQTAGYYTSARGGWGIPFLHVGRRLECRLYNNSVNVPLAVKVDGKILPLSYAQLVAGTSVTGNNLVLFDFGANAETFNGVEVTTINVGGVGYVLDEVVTLGAGTFTTPMKIRVKSVTGGVVTSARIEDPGSYSAKPTSPVAQASSTGAGTGLTVSPSYGSTHSTRKGRVMEFRFGRNVYFGGFNIDAGDVFLPIPSVARSRRLWIGDSFLDSLYSSALTGVFGAQANDLLGDCEGWYHGIAGLLWGENDAAGTTVHNNRAIITPKLQDRLVIPLGTNDSATSQAGLTASVIEEIEYYWTQKPNMLVTLIAGFAFTTPTLAAKCVAGISGALATLSKPNQVRFVDLAANSPYANTTDFRCTDSTGHPSLAGNSSLARMVAIQVAASEASMLAVTGN